MLVGAGTIWVTRVVGTAVFRKEAMGFGDVTLMAMVGAFLGWQPVVLVFFIAPFLGLAGGIAQLVLRGDNVLPFGPYLSLATAMVLLAWDAIWVFAGPRFAFVGLLGFAPLAGIALVIVPPVWWCFVRSTPYTRTH
jgi:leader peptidase (prepilin peptidase)/N-methyltransferase